MAKKKELIKEELKLIGKIKAYFPAGEISPEIIRAWNNCSDIMFFLKLTELFGEMPEKSLEKSEEQQCVERIALVFHAPPSLHPRHCCCSHLLLPLPLLKLLLVHSLRRG